MGWNERVYSFGDDNVVYLEIESLDEELVDLIDDCIVKICYGDPRLTIEEAKEYILDFIEGKDIRRRMGAVAEFFIHLYLGTKGLLQECLFTNLEENSPKKGFDGVYVDEVGNTWYMESKAGDGANTTHYDKIELAYTNLKNRIESIDRTKNNPWMNALNHVKILRDNEPLEERLLQISRQFRAGTAQNIANYSIIPCGTIVDDSNIAYDGSTVVSDCYRYLSARDYGSIFGVCVTNRVLEEFERYLRDEL